MKIFNKVSIVVLAVAFMFGFAGLKAAQAATSPALGATTDYGVASDTFTNSNTGSQTDINGKVCATTLNVPIPVTITGGVADVPCPPAVGTDQAAALADVNLQASLPGCTALGAAVALNAVIIGANPPGTFPPGCYSSTGAMTITTGTAVTLLGGGTYIFKPGAALTTGDDSQVILAGGAQACEVFWAPTGATTLGAYTGAMPNPTSFAGTIFRGDAAGLSITLGHFSNLVGRALAFGSTVTTDANTITVPSCVVPPPPPSGGTSAPISPIFPLINVTKIPSPLNLPSGPGSVTYTYTVTNIGEVAVTNVNVKDNKCDSAIFIDGDDNNDSILDLDESWVYKCTKTVSATETNTVTACATAGNSSGRGTMCDTANATITVGIPVIPPLIHIIKKPNVFLLPAGGGAVTYSYTITNPGTEPLHNVSVIDNKCTGLPGRVVGHPGDLNKNNLLESNESWSFTCLTNITQTTTNIATAEGSANGLFALDYAQAVVTVAAPMLPNTGMAPTDIATIVIGLLMAIGVFYYLARKKQTA